MSSSRTITLFSERPQVSHRASSFVVSLLAHAAVVSFLSLAMIYSPDLNDSILPRRYTMRRLDLHSLPDRPRQSAGQGDFYPGPRSDEKKPAPGQHPAAQQPVLRRILNAVKGPQTLIQPDIAEPVKLAVETPVPTVVIWNANKTQVTRIVAPLPQPATASDVKPSLDAPNQEVDLADLAVSSTAHPTDKLPVLPSNTSPVVVENPKKPEMTPATASQTREQPTPAAVLSLSDTRMPDGSAALPPVNETTAQNQSGALAPGQATRNDQSNHAAAPAPGQAAGNQQPKGNQQAAAPAPQPIAAPGDRNGTRPGPDAGSGSDQGRTTLKISLPKDGAFGAVVVGASLEEKFPEISGVWNDRVAYTVYLHVGLRRSWILQYSLPRNTEAASSGTLMRLEAPWPYNIVRPNIAPGAINSNALLVHGFVSQAGQFESLVIAFPPEFPEAQFVLDALRQWQFRPAAQNGQAARVEVLLIIPDDPEESLELVQP